MKVGLYFGSFNPIHTGHLIIAQSFLNSAPEIQQLWFVVSPQNPFKVSASLAPETLRLEMVEFAIARHPRMFASNVEFALPKPSYTIDTLTHLSKKFPSYDFSLLMGEDNLKSFHKWKKYEVILKYYPIYVYPRKSPNTENFFTKYPQVRKIEAPMLDISATYIRKIIASGKSCRYMVPEPVFEFIRKNHLYEKTHS